MSLRDKLVHEIKAVGIAALYFGTWLAVLILIKQLILAEYEIQFYGLSKALVGALILSKVVIVLDHVPLGDWARRRPAWVTVVLRTLLCGLGVLVILLLERGFEGRTEYGGFMAALRAMLAATDIYHVWVNTIVLSGALFVYNLFSVIRRHLGEGGLLGMLAAPLPADDLAERKSLD